MVKKRAMAEGMMKEQLKRKRETRLLEEKLAKLVPLVQEANLMADEMKKGVKFEARLQVKSNAKSALEELSNMQAIEPNVVMTDNNGSEWNWSVVKFDSRLYMMREMYQEFSDFGPRDIPKAKDPFWDPPEPHEIGKAFVYLKALAHLVEIENQFTIVDFEGKPQGSLKLDIYPEGPDGEDLDYLQSPDEIVGKKVSFRVKIPGATGLPSKYSNDVFVRFKFFDDTNQYETEAHDSKSTDPKFTFETKVEFEEITEEVKNFFLNDAAVFEVLGFNDQASSELNLGDDSGPAVCEQCEETGAEFLCLDCQTKFCSGCFNLMHKSAKKRGHHKESLVVEVVIDDSEVCYQCEENKAAVYCQECDKQLCSACEGLLHRSAKKKGHTRTPVGAGTPPPDAGTPLADGKVMCEWCEEKTADVKCVDCDQLMCNDCNKLMHKSKKKAGHVRESL